MQIGLVLAHLVEGDYLVIVQKRLDDTRDLSVDDACANIRQHERSVRREGDAAEVPWLEVERCTLWHAVRACR